MKNKFAAVLLSVLAAFALWWYVITTVSPGSEAVFSNIPVTLTGDAVLSERGLMITSDIPAVTLRLSGNRSDLNRLTSASIRLEASLTGIYEPGEHELSYDIIYPGEFANNAFVAESQSPRQITVMVESRISKQVPVETRFMGQVPEGYMLDRENSSLDYDAVTVTGPQSVVDQIEKAVIELDVEGRTETINESLSFVLCNAQDEPVDVEQIVTDVGRINVTVPIQRMKTVELTVDVISGGGATEATSEINIDPLTIQVAGSDTLLENLEEIKLGTINLGEISSTETERTFAIQLPEGIRNLTGQTEAKVSIRFPDLRTVSCRVTNFQQVNVPEGMQAEVLTKELTVNIRGPQTLMANFKETDVIIRVDLSNASQGASTVRAEVVLPAEFSAAGAVGSYSVNVNVSPAEEG
ncbi:MAG TPA: hypothetical protein IAC31_02865 [Candidatus Faecousia intestinigallinarum]|nr:hypothetical protein [Candidatus Faecousia intestinigallinarum]